MIGIVPYVVGYNKYEMSMTHKTIHAEVDAMLKLPKQKKKKNIILCVFTTSKYGDKLITSKCCCNCIKSIQCISNKKNYIVKKIYCIDEKRNLITMKN